MKIKNYHSIRKKTMPAIEKVHEQYVLLFTFYILLQIPAT